LLVHGSVFNTEMAFFLSLTMTKLLFVIHPNLFSQGWPWENACSSRRGTRGKFINWSKQNFCLEKWYVVPLKKLWKNCLSAHVPKAFLISQTSSLRTCFLLLFENSITTCFLWSSKYKFSLLKKKFSLLVPLLCQQLMLILCFYRVLV